MAAGISWVEARDAAKHATVSAQSSPQTKTHPAQTVSSAETEKPCFASIPPSFLNVIAWLFLRKCTLYTLLPGRKKYIFPITFIYIYLPSSASDALSLHFYAKKSPFSLKACSTVSSLYAGFVHLSLWIHSLLICVPELCLLAPLPSSSWVGSACGRYQHVTTGWVFTSQSQPELPVPLQPQFALNIPSSIAPTLVELQRHRPCLVPSGQRWQCLPTVAGPHVHHCDGVA